MAAAADPEVAVGAEQDVFPIDFEFKDIHLEVKLPRPRPWKPSKGKREILKGVSGMVRSGESLAILGPSGSGKTTLLDVLADRRRESSFTGERRINSDTNMATYRHLTAYVPQEDALFPRLTVEESLLYSARLRLKSSLPDVEKKKAVSHIIDVLGLESCRGGMVGGRGGVRGVSGGERRRTSIGMELVTTPSLLFLDEPTSGLDASSALTVAHIVRALAAKGRTIILTIHQPSAAILSCFTNVMFLSEGEVMYYGPPDKLTGFMQSVGSALPEGANPADHMLELIADKSKDRAAVMAAAAPLAPAPGGGEAHQPLSADARKEYKKSRPGPVKQMGILTFRNFLVSIRSPEMFLGRVFLLAFNAIVLSTVFWRVWLTSIGYSLIDILQRGKDTSVAAAREILGFIVFTIAMSMFTSFQALPIFLDEKDIYRRERGSGYYSLGAYAMALLAVQLPFLVALAVLYTGISYYLVALAPGAEYFFFFVLLMFCTLFAAQSFVLFLSAAVPNAGAGQGLGAAVFSYFFLFAGFFIAARDIPNYWYVWAHIMLFLSIWVYWISLFRYPLQAGAENHFQASGVGPFNVCTANNGVGGGAMLDFLGVSHGINKWLLLLILCGFALLYRVLFFLILKFFVTSKRR